MESTLLLSTLSNSAGEVLTVMFDTISEKNFEYTMKLLELDNESRLPGEVNDPDLYLSTSAKEFMKDMKDVCSSCESVFLSVDEDLEVFTVKGVGSFGTGQFRLYPDDSSDNENEDEVGPPQKKTKITFDREIAWRLDRHGDQKGGPLVAQI